MKTTRLLLAALLLLPVVPAQAQYHYSYGDSRVVNQNQTGLYQPSGTYIGAGTLSRSAQGKGSGVGGLAGPQGLPSVNLGAHVRTPGDNIYDNNGTDRQSNGALIYKDQEQMLAAQARLKILRQQRMFQRQQQQPQGTFYMPGSNGAAASYSEQTQAPILYRNGAATYGGYGKQPTRNF